MRRNFALGHVFAGEDFLDGRPRELAVDNIIETLRNNGYGDTLELKGLEALDEYFDMRQGKAKVIRDLHQS